MRTKALLIGAAIGAIGLATSMAQGPVYSVNIVGYINVNITGKAPGTKGAWTLIANQLNATGGNALENLFPAPPTAISIFKFNNDSQGYDIANWDTGFQEWDNPLALQLNPGDAFFVLNGETTAWTQTFVGEVQTGTTTKNLHKGWNGLSCVVPQSGLLQTELGWVPGAVRGDSIYKFNTTAQSYDIYNYDAGFQEWEFNGEAIEPSLAVGEGFLVLRGDEGGTWTRTFNVGQ